MRIHNNHKSEKSVFISKWAKGVTMLGLALVALSGLLLFRSGPINAQTTANGDLKILKSEVKSQAKFYPVKVDGVKMEVIAVRASDGTIRTAFNTCQVCFDSGRGYYVQQGAELVCQNCGNRFHIDRIEKIRYGCNPVPITPDLKKDDGKYITISKSVLAQVKGLFARWGKK